MFNNYEKTSPMKWTRNAGNHIRNWKGPRAGLQKHVRSGMHQFSLVAVLGIAVGAVQLFAVPAHAQSQTIYVSTDRAVDRAQQAMAEGQMEVALAYFRKAEDRNISAENRVIVQNSICAVAFKLGAYAEAETSCSQAIDGDETYWKAFVNRGNVRRASGNITGAISDYCEAIRLSPEHVKGNFSKQKCLG